jgi:NAD+ synthase
MKLEKQNSPDPTALIDDISHWIRHQVKMAGVPGIVVGLSGGLDSSVAGVLCRRALEDADAVRGLILPCHSDPLDEAHARRLAQRFEIPTETIDLGPVFDVLVSILPSAGRLPLANLKPRLRMIALYYYANELGFLVVGSGNRSELLPGYFTKYGDGGVDLLPLGGLFKTEVKALGEALGIPAEILEKAPGAGLWQGQTDEGEMGISYAELDRALIALQGSQTDGRSDEVVERVRRMVSRSRHKRTPIPICEH